MGRQQIAPNPATANALQILGQQIRIARSNKRLSQTKLAAMAGVSTVTLSAIENGSPSPSIGNVLNVATLAGVPLFGTDDPSELLKMKRRGEELLALLPARVDTPKPKDDDGLNF